MGTRYQSTRQGPQAPPSVGLAAGEEGQHEAQTVSGQGRQSRRHEGSSMTVPRNRDRGGGGGVPNEARSYSVAGKRSVLLNSIIILWLHAFTFGFIADERVVVEVGLLFVVLSLLLLCALCSLLLYAVSSSSSRAVTGSGSVL